MFFYIERNNMLSVLWITYYFKFCDLSNGRSRWRHEVERPRSGLKCFADTSLKRSEFYISITKSLHHLNGSCIKISLIFPKRTCFLPKKMLYYTYIQVEDMKDLAQNEGLLCRHIPDKDFCADLRYDIGKVTGV